MERYFAEAISPLLLIDRDGAVVWRNTTAQSRFGPASPRDLLGSERLRELTSGHAPRSFRLRLISSAGVATRETVTALPIDGAQPGEERFLLHFSAIPGSDGANSELRDLLATLTHDLKNPLGALFSYADALLDTSVGEGLSDRHRDILGRVRSTANRAIDLLRNYQQLAELQCGRVEATVHSCDLNEMVHLVTDSSLRDHELARITQRTSPEPLLVSAHRVQIDRIISNLIGNALKFSPEGSEIVVETIQRHGMAVLQVSNSGPAIPAVEIAALFQPYSRATNSRDVPGSGLGLYIVRSLAEALGGSVQVRSDEVGGTRFSVSLPLTTPRG